jgi:putative oxidoreductase
MINQLERRVGQALLGALFIKLGFDAAVDPGPRVDKAAALGLPNAELAVRGNGAAMVAGGAALTLDKLPRLAALGLIASMIPTTLAGHAFWDFHGAERKAHEIQLLKNAGLVGGLLLVLTLPNAVTPSGNLRTGRSIQAQRPLTAMPPEAWA